MMYLTDEEIEKGFWNREIKESFPPNAITYPDEYNGGEAINIVCTQLSISNYQQRKLVNKWCQIIPDLENVRFIWFYSKVNQALFDAVCENQGIVGLYIKWSGIKDISNLKKLKNLRYLRIGSSASVESIDVLSEMAQLNVLEIENFKKIRDLSPIKSLNQLEGLAVEGSIWTTQYIESLKPLSELKKLKYLFLTNIRTGDKTIKPLAKMKSLQHIRTSYHWSKSEFKLLRDSLPELQFGSPLEFELVERFCK